MRIGIVAAAALLVAGTALASPAYVVHENLKQPSGYQKSHQPDPETKLSLRIYLAQTNLHLLPTWLMNVSHPDSPYYGKHWEPQQVADAFHNGEGLDEVRKWLVASGFDASRVVVGRNAGWVGVKDTTVSEVEGLLKCEYWVYNGPEGQHTGKPESRPSITETLKNQAAMTQYSVPADLADHIDFVLNTPPPQRKGKIEPVSTVKEAGQANITQILKQLDDCTAHTTPVCLRSLYGIIYEPSAVEKNSYGIVEYTPQAFVQSDLDDFFGNFSGDGGFYRGLSPIVVGIDGGFVQTDSRSFDYNGESNLDLQYGMEMVSSKQPVTLYQVGDIQIGEDVSILRNRGLTMIGASFNNFLDALDASFCGGEDPYYDAIYPDPTTGGYMGPPDCGTSKPANVISTSYSYNEAELSAKYMERQCWEYGKLGLMGVTVLYSSGDSGVAGNSDLCLDDHGEILELCRISLRLQIGFETYRGQRFNPSFPSSCPWVTSVGATMVTSHPPYPNSQESSNATTPSPDAARYVEQACEKIIYSGGGFSNVFPMPSYQSTLVNDYLKAYASTVQYGSAPGYRWNNTGTRAFPDISANGANYVVAVNGKFSLVYGTSASAPVVGGIFTLINDARIANGKTPVGFVNPSLYHPSFKKAFHDITVGGNPGCGTGGFRAVPGWDPVTGMGTPNFAAMMDRWANM
ncbi:subtilisin-like protein [Hymenopellis radicata]|nr:subtilisin-like protein [Hymenopellis radicata]